MYVMVNIYTINEWCKRATQAVSCHAHLPKLQNQKPQSSFTVVPMLTMFRVWCFMYNSLSLTSSLWLFHRTACGPSGNLLKSNIFGEKNLIFLYSASTLWVTAGFWPLSFGNLGIVPPKSGMQSKNINWRTKNIWSPVSVHTAGKV